MEFTLVILSETTKTIHGFALLSDMLEELQHCESEGYFLVDHYTTGKGSFFVMDKIIEPVTGEVSVLNGKKEWIKNEVRCYGKRD